MATLWRECQEAWLGGAPRPEIPPGALEEARRRAQGLRDEAVADALAALRRRIVGARQN
jgi:hypothetical protein